MADEAPKAEEKVEVPEQKPAETIADIIKSDEPKNEPKTVPEAAFLEEKKARKALEKELKSLKSSIDNGSSDKEVSADIEAIAAQYQDVDKNFLRKYAEAVETRAFNKAQALIDEKLKPLETERHQEKLDKVFNTHYAKALADMPEYENVANKEVIKALSLLPQNATKTFAQLIEDTYGNALRGKRTIETTSPRGGVAPGTFDINRANTDPAYLAEVLKTPELKKQYDTYVDEKIKRS